MNPSESAIERAIEGLRTSPGVFQRLVERFAEVELPDFFSGLTPQGRNSKGVAIRGWPDFVRGKNAGEATYSKDWRGHLKNDLALARANSVDYFLFVAWAKAPKATELDTRRAEASQALGITEDRIRFVFKEEIRRTLAQPRFAREWVEILSLPSGCHPFVALSKKVAAGEPALALFGGVDSFLPTIEDYRLNRVYQSPLRKETVEKLSENEWALIWGHGAAGKTTLALDIALNSSIGSTVAYYLSFYQVAQEGQISLETAMDIMATRADRNVLFILDDIHLGERAASSLFAHWRQIKNGSRMLMLGRHKEVTTAANGQISPFSEIQASELAVDIESLYGAFRRLVPAGESSPEPAGDVLDKWLRLFGGDLIAFGAAVQNRRDALASGNWLLEPRDAAIYVRRRYLRGLSQRERRNLLRLATCYGLHQPLPIEALEEGDLEVSEGRGIIRLRAGRGYRPPSYTLVHEGVAKLILEAADPKPDIDVILTDIAVSAPARGFDLARVLENEGRAATSRMVLETIWAQTDWPTCGATLETLDVDVEMATRLMKLTHAQISERLEAGIGGLAAAIPHTPLHEIRRILGWLNKRFRAIFLRLTTEMRSDAGISHLQSRCVKQLSSLMYFLLPLSDERDFRELHDSWRIAIFPHPLPTSMPPWIVDANIAAVSALIPYLERRRPYWASAVINFYSSTTQLRRLADACITSLPLTVFQLLQTGLGPSLFPLIDQAAWAEQRLKESPSILSIFTYEQQLERYPAYRVLLEPIARAIVRSIARDPSSCGRISLSSLLAIFPYVVKEERSYLMGFLDACADHPDLDIRSLYSLCETVLVASERKWPMYEEALGGSILITKSLVQILQVELSQPDEAVLVMALWGLASRLGVSPSALSDTPVDADLLDLAFQYDIHFAVGADCGLTLTLFWLGIREAVSRGETLPRRYILALEKSLAFLQSYRPASATIEFGRSMVVDWLTEKTALAEAIRA